MLADFEDLTLLRAGVGDGKKVVMIKQNYTRKHTKWMTELNRLKQTIHISILLAKQSWSSSMTQPHYAIIYIT